MIEFVDDKNVSFKQLKQQYIIVKSSAIPIYYFQQFIIP
jgi:hypothetical protein